MAPISILHDMRDERRTDSGEAVWTFDGQYVDETGRPCSQRARVARLIALAENDNGETLGFAIAAPPPDQSAWRWLSLGGPTDALLRFLASAWGVPAPAQAKAQVLLTDAVGFGQDPEADAIGGLPFGLGGDLAFGGRPGAGGLYLDVRAKPWLVEAGQAEVSLVELDSAGRPAVLAALSAQAHGEREA